MLLHEVSFIVEWKSRAPAATGKAAWPLPATERVGAGMAARKRMRGGMSGTGTERPQTVVNALRSHEAAFSQPAT
ncbi:MULTISPECIES: hypothetical protein [Burkholderia cepacia complex]|jgi:hypothetical protein|uniref:hypothetical protein n=1 Tax=Burkholderia cepacia complex TaxID=87882 RepID=UPI001055A701|nr:MULTISPECIES: hypothetical protein [Burkholderia cepacia complex]MDP9581206.1 hypothetical protein [Burkholderia contaminans]